MRLFFILCLWMPILASAQDASEKSACQSYEKMLAKAQAEESKGQYPLAVELYNIARIMAKNCPSAKNDFIKKKLAEISGKINNQEKDKLAAELAAGTAQKDRKEAENKAKKAQLEAEKEKKAKEEADKLRKEAEEAKAQAEAANKVAQAAKEEAERQKNLAEAQRLRNEVLLHATTSKKNVDIHQKRNYFRLAYVNIRDSINSDKTAFFEEPIMIEAAYESVFENLQQYRLDSTQRLFDNSNINGFALANNGRKLYAAAGNGLVAEAVLGISDSVHTPSALWNRYNTANIPCVSKDVRFCSQKLNDVAVSPDGSLVAAAGESEQLIIFKEGAFMPDLSPQNLHPKAYISALVFINNEQIVSVGTDKKLVIYNINTKQQSSHDLLGLPMQLSYMPDYMGGTLLVSTLEGVQTIEPATGKMGYFIRNKASKTPYYSIVLAKENKLLVAHNSKLTIYKIGANGQGADSLFSHDIAQDVVDMAYDGEQMAIIGFASGDVQLWNTTNIESPYASPVCLQQPLRPLVRVAYYAPGKQIISSGKSAIFFSAIDVHRIFDYLKKNNLGNEKDVKKGSGSKY